MRFLLIAVLILTSLPVHSEEIEIPGCGIVVPNAATIVDDENGWRCFVYAAQESVPKGAPMSWIRSQLRFLEAEATGEITKYLNTIVSNGSVSETIDLRRQTITSDGNTTNSTLNQEFIQGFKKTITTDNGLVALSGVQKLGEIYNEKLGTTTSIVGISRNSIDRSKRMGEVISNSNKNDTTNDALKLPSQNSTSDKGFINISPNINNF